MAPGSYHVGRGLTRDLAVIICKSMLKRLGKLARYNSGAEGEAF